MWLRFAILHLGTFSLMLELTILYMFIYFYFSEAFYSSVRSELEADAVELETESWSSAVEPPFAKKQKKEVIKRQDVIYGENPILYPIE